jgi:hypothetical protein
VIRQELLEMILVLLTNEIIYGFFFFFWWYANLYRENYINKIIILQVFSEQIFSVNNHINKIIINILVI